MRIYLAIPKEVEISSKHIFIKLITQNSGLIFHAYF